MKILSETLTVKKPASANNPSTGSQTVVVASKLSFGLVLNLYETQEVTVEVNGQRRTYPQYFLKRGAPTYTLNGNSYEKRLGDKGQHIECGFAITMGIPKDFWEEWLSQNKEGDYIRNGMVFAHSDLSAVKSEAAEKESLKTGFERMDPDNLPKIGKHKLETADRKSY